MWPSIGIFVIELAVLFSSMFVHGDLQNPCLFDVKLKYMLRNEGFHRNITYSIVFPVASEHQWLYDGCIIGIQQPLPPGVYVNADELEDLRRSQRLTAVPKGRVNIELPAEQARESGVYLMGPVLENRTDLWLPVHARYHKAVKGGGFARNTIAPPSLYLRCSDDRLARCNRSVYFLCKGGSIDTCNWKEMPYTLLTDLLQWDVPVGDTDHYYVVATVSIASIVVGSLYLLKIIHEYKVKGRRKEQ